MAHLSQLLPGERALLAPQKGRLLKNLTLASGEATTLVVTADLPKDSYVLVQGLINKNNSSPLKSLHITQTISLCLDGRSAVCVGTNQSIGPVTVGANTPICQLSCVRPDFEHVVLKQQQDKMSPSPGSPRRPPCLTPQSTPAPPPPGSPPPLPRPCPPGQEKRKKKKIKKKSNSVRNHYSLQKSQPF